MADSPALTEKDRALIRGAEIAHERAAHLLSWWKQKRQADELRYLSTPMPRDPAIRVEYFYDNLQMEGKPATAMGCRWRSRFAAKSRTRLGSTFETFLRDQFMREAKWENPDGLPGGFEFIAHQYRKSGGGEGVFGPGELPKLSEIGSRYDWVVFEAVVHDFFRNVPGPAMKRGMLRRMPRMASYVLVHPDYFQSFYGPEPNAANEVSFGYSFLPMEVKPSMLGYGPGKFKAAVKQFRWILHQNSDVEIEMFFLVSTRSEKILDLGGFDPVYGTASLLDLCTFRALGVNRKFHDKMDALQLAIHARVYQSLMDGMRRYWEDHDWSAQ